MKDVHQVLTQKEMDIVRVQKEIEALHLVIALLAEERDWSEHGMALPSPFSQAQGTGTTGMKRGP